MSKRFLLLLLQNILIFSLVCSQTKPIRSELSLLTDNDVFFSTDYYYSAGQEIAYKNYINPNSGFQDLLCKSDTTKLVLILRGGIKMFTPRKTGQTDIKKKDRPYAGYDYLNVGVVKFTKQNQGSAFNIEIGLVGTASGVDRIQSNWHEFWHLRPFYGWEGQISNEVVLNLNYSFLKAWQISKGFDIVNNSSITGGTGSNKLSQDFSFRLLRFNPLKESNFCGTVLGPSSNRKEFYLFGGIGLDYVISNIFLEGSLFENRISPLTYPAEPFVFRQNIGLMFSAPNWFCSAKINHLSKEVSEGLDHTYGSINLGFRF